MLPAASLAAHALKRATATLPAAVLAAPAVTHSAAMLPAVEQSTAMLPTAAPSAYALKQSAAMLPVAVPSALALTHSSAMLPASALVAHMLNSSAATLPAAVLAALTDANAAECCGRGTGLDEAGLAHKVASVRAAVAMHAPALENPQFVAKTVVDYVMKFKEAPAAPEPAAAVEA